MDHQDFHYNTLQEFARLLNIEDYLHMLGLNNQKLLIHLRTLVNFDFQGLNNLHQMVHHNLHHRQDHQDWLHNLHCLQNSQGHPPLHCPLEEVL